MQGPKQPIASVVAKHTPAVGEQRDRVVAIALTKLRAVERSKHSSAEIGRG